METGPSMPSKSRRAAGRRNAVSNHPHDQRQHLEHHAPSIPDSSPYYANPFKPPAAGWAEMSGENVNIVDAGTNRIIEVDHGETFVARCRLRNLGEVAWKDRLLVRLGPVVASSLAFTPPVLPLPDTPPGNECPLVISGRAPWLPNLTTVVFAMTIPDGTPAMPGSLQLTVDAREVTRLRENVPVSRNLALRLRRGLAS
jgi:hypothetical protein